MADEFILNKSNIAIRVSAGLGVLERKIFNLALFFLEKNKECTEIVIPLKWIYTIHSSTIQTKSKIKKAAQKLMRAINFSNQKFEGWEDFTYITYAKIEGGNLILNMHQKLIHFLSADYAMSNGGYTPTSLKEMKSLNSIHSLAFYEMINRKIKQSRGQSDINITVKEIRQELNCMVSYVDFFEFNKQVLQKVVRDINAFTNLNISFQKDAKTPHTLSFKVAKNQKIPVEQDRIITHTVKPAVTQINAPMNAGDILSNISFTQEKPKPKPVEKRNNSIIYQNETKKELTPEQINSIAREKIRKEEAERKQAEKVHQEKQLESKKAYDNLIASKKHIEYDNLSLEQKQQILNKAGLTPGNFFKITPSTPISEIKNFNTALLIFKFWGDVGHA